MQSHEEGDLLFAFNVNLGFPTGDPEWAAFFRDHGWRTENYDDPRIHRILPGRGAGLLRSQRTRVRRCGELDWRYHVSSAASNALAIAGLLLPARTASPMAMTVCPGLANDLKRSAVPSRAL